MKFHKENRRKKIIKICNQNILLKKIFNEFFIEEQKVVKKDLTMDYGINFLGKKKYVSAAVLVAIINKKEPYLLLTKRSSSLKSHPGQLSFPGGKVEKNDANLLETAFRESFEEVGIKKENFFFIGELPKHRTITGYEINPFLVIMQKNQNFKKNNLEVDEIITVPLNFLINSENFFIRHYKNQKKIRKYFTIPYGHYYIWGATAQIIKSLTDRINNEI